MANLRIEHLNKRYGAATVLSDVNLNIEAGEFVVLVGLQAAASRRSFA